MNCCYVFAVECFCCDDNYFVNIVRQRWVCSDDFPEWYWYCCRFTCAVIDGCLVTTIIFVTRAIADRGSVTDGVMVTSDDPN